MGSRTAQSAVPPAARGDSGAADRLETAAVATYRTRRALAEAIREAARRGDAAARLDAALRLAW